MKQSVNCFIGDSILSPSQSATHQHSSRFLFVDGLRGIAAIGVVIHHILWFAPWHDFGSELATNLFFQVGYWGKCGVPVFFVISGFVIAHSLRNAVVTPRYAGNFFLRRSMRLDPPYWVAIALVIAIDAACIHLYSIEPPMPLPSTGQLAAHFIYIQNILGLGNISVGFWTLCIEVQFYMLFIVMLGAAQYVSRRYSVFHPELNKPGAVSSRSLIAIFAPVMLASLFGFSHYEQFDDWFLRYYCLFCLGACLAACNAGMLPQRVAWIVLTLFAIRVSLDVHRSILSAFVAGLLILAASNGNGLSTWLQARPWQFFGKISYSLYLIHFPVAHLVMHFGKALSGEYLPAVFMWLAISFALSILAAVALHRLVEAPSIAWASRFGKSRKSRPLEETVPQTPVQPASRLADRMVLDSPRTAEIITESQSV